MHALATGPLHLSCARICALRDSSVNQQPGWPAGRRAAMRTQQSRARNASLLARVGSAPRLRSQVPRATAALVSGCARALHLRSCLAAPAEKSLCCQGSSAPPAAAFCGSLFRGRYLNWSGSEARNYTPRQPQRARHTPPRRHSACVTRAAWGPACHRCACKSCGCRRPELLRCGVFREQV